MPWNLEHRNQRRPPQMAASSILGPRRHSRPVVPGSLNLAVRDVLYCRGTLGSLAMLTAIRKASSRVSRLATNCGQFSAMRNVAHGPIASFRGTAAIGRAGRKHDRILAWLQRFGGHSDRAEWSAGTTSPSPKAACCGRRRRPRMPSKLHHGALNYIALLDPRMGMTIQPIARLELVQFDNDLLAGRARHIQPSDFVPPRRILCEAGRRHHDGADPGHKGHGALICSHHTFPLFRTDRTGAGTRFTRTGSLAILAALRRASSTAKVKLDVVQ